ncbi:hypothetical protein CBR_g367 [Chara braunii]|uniref:Uncharacterized protein n=1 Tax=Chara braunii TaxID=69332 RepID=A0A388JQD9_CHABU|nr:hypothetical protein CBR_g367 [Chara braunii]|eukprot:GBG60036.1 hypothetical protein CBR_g367 [Chara braunii]
MDDYPMFALLFMSIIWRPLLQFIFPLGFHRTIRMTVVTKSDRVTEPYTAEEKTEINRRLKEKKEEKTNKREEELRKKMEMERKKLEEEMAKQLEEKMLRQLEEDRKKSEEKEKKVELQVHDGEEDMVEYVLPKEEEAGECSYETTLSFDQDIPEVWVTQFDYGVERPEDETAEEVVASKILETATAKEREYLIIEREAKIQLRLAAQKTKECEAAKRLLEEGEALRRRMQAQKEKPKDVESRLDLLTDVVMHSTQETAALRKAVEKIETRQEDQRDCDRDMVAYSQRTALKTFLDAICNRFEDKTRAMKTAERLNNIHLRKWKSVSSLKATMDELLQTADHGLTPEQILNNFARTLPDSIKSNLYAKIKEDSVTYDKFSKLAVEQAGYLQEANCHWYKDLEKGKAWKGKTIAGSITGKDNLVVMFEEGGCEALTYDQIEYGLDGDRCGVQGGDCAAVVRGGGRRGKGGRGRGGRGWEEKDVAIRGSATMDVVQREVGVMDPHMVTPAMPPNNKAGVKDITPLPTMAIRAEEERHHGQPLLPRRPDLYDTDYRAGLGDAAVQSVHQPKRPTIRLYHEETGKRIHPGHTSKGPLVDSCNLPHLKTRLRLPL